MRIGTDLPSFLGSVIDCSFGLPLRGMVQWQSSATSRPTHAGACKKTTP